MSLLQFDEYELDIPQRRLTESGKPLRLGARAFDILAVLASRAGRVVSNEELMEAVWPSTKVEDGAIRVHLVSLRKTLGAKSRHYIENIPGRGYTFAATIQSMPLRATAPETQQPTSNDNLPRLPGKLLGRDEFVASVVSHIEESRIVTIVGAGGIGKTSTAIKIAEMLTGSYRVIFLDLAAISTEQNLVPSLATKLGLSVYGTDALPAIMTELSKRSTLLFLDNCEHVVAAAADMAEAILSEVDSVRILTTSREPLRVCHEKVRQLAPLAMPREDEAVDDVTAFPALDLFIKLASLSGDHSEFETETGVTLASDIVRRLDGIPLAIELAAARSFDMDMHSLHRSVADPISLLRRGRRTAPPRQQTLKATMDWSFELLSEPEKELLIRLGVFAGSFSSEAAHAVAGAIDEEDFYQAFDGLFLKSLMSATEEGGKYRLLATTKDYVTPKLAAADYSFSCHLAHAQYCQDKLVEAEKDWTSLETAQWLRKYANLIHDVRAALDWAFSASGNRLLGIELSANSHVLWTQLGLMSEQMGVAERALRQLESTGESLPTLEMKLLISFAGAMYHTRSSESDETSIGLFRRAARIAEELKDHPKLLRASGGITAIHTMNGEYPSAIEVVKRFEETSKGTMPNIASRMLNHNLHYIGDLDGAMEHAEIALTLAQGGVRGTLNNGASYDQRLSSLSTVVKTLWIKGELTASMQGLRAALSEALKLDHPISTCLFLAVSGCPTALGMGNLHTGSELLDLLMVQAGQNSLLRWLEWGQSYQGVVRAKLDGDVDLFNRTLEASKGARFENSLVVAGELASVSTIERALDSNAGWCRAELFRLRGLQMLDVSADEGRRWMMDGYDLAVSQGAGFWELKCATSLLKHDRGPDLGPSRQRLKSTMGKFAREIRTTDVEEAILLL